MQNIYALGNVFSDVCMLKGTCGSLKQNILDDKGSGKH